MISWFKERRRKKRYQVLWDAELEAVFSDYDYKGGMDVTVVDFSGLGAVIHAKDIYMDRRHLAAPYNPPELNLKIHSPEGILEYQIDIKRYDLLIEDKVFEIGVEFLNISSKNQELVDLLIKNLRLQKKGR
ncbi:MAG: PilZ domain-containing protein [Thermodesulfobacteriota bacterium]|nr:PilZ domain-containing protein [Thermodesulfobacteriota bacterium]